MSGLMWVKLCRDVRAAWPRFVLMAVAIAVSLTAFAAVLLAWATSREQAADAYLGTRPASATIVLGGGVEPQRMAAIAAQARGRPGVLEAAGRTQFSGDVEVGGRLLDIPLQVFIAAPDDPMRVATFHVQQGLSWPPAPGEILLAADTLSLLDVAVGDTIAVTTPSGQRVRVRVTGTVYDPSLSPSPQEQTGRGYLSLASLPGPEARLDQLKLQIAEPGQAEPSTDRDAIVAAASEVGQWLQEEHGLAVREIQVPQPYAHPHQWQADALLGALLAGGAAALLLSTILVATMLKGLFTQQIPQIGIMKAVGARSGRIGRFYLGMALLVAVAATGLALPAAVALGRFAVGTFLGFLGIVPSSMAAPGWTYLVILATGLGLPPLVAAFPVVKAGRITVRAAIDHHGGGAASGPGSRLLARLGNLRNLDRGLLLAARNTVRRPARFLLSAGLLATAATVFVAGMSLGTATEAVAEEQTALRTWDVDVQLASPAPADRVVSLVRGLPAVGRVEGLAVMPTGVAGPGRIPVTRTYPDQGHGRVALTAVPDDTATGPPQVVEGRWLEPGETGAVVLNQVTRANTMPGARPGDTVEIILGGRPTTWRVVGIAQERGHGSGVYATGAGLARATGQPEQVTQLRITTLAHDETSRAAVADEVTKMLRDNGIEVRNAASITRGEAITAGHLGPIVLILLGIALPLGVVGFIGLATTMSANILERTREFGIMHAIGARPKAVRRIVIAEGVVLALASCLLAALPALGLTWLLGRGLGDLFFNAPLPYRLSVPAALIWIAVVTLGAILATEAAATRAARITVREALAHL